MAARMCFPQPDSMASLSASESTPESLSFYLKAGEMR